MIHRLKSTRQSINWLREELGENSLGEGSPDKYYYLTYTSWLIDDVRNRVLPVPGYTRKTFSISLVPFERKVEKLVTKGLGTRNDWRELPSATHEFFSMCAAAMLAHGEAHYEIVYFLDEEEKIGEFRLLFIPSGSLSIQKQEIIQHIPHIIVQKRNLPSNQIQLSPDSILIFQLPEYVRKSFSHTMESLAIIGREIIPPFAKEITFGQRQGYFDFARFTESKNLALADATKLIGWNGRQTINESTLEFYQLYRLLRLERFIVELRNQILTTLNEGLERIGRRVGFSGQIVVKGLPSLSDVEKAEIQLQEGLCKFEDVMRLFHLY